MELLHANLALMRLLNSLSQESEEVTKAELLYTRTSFRFFEFWIYALDYGTNIETIEESRLSEWNNVF